MKSLLKSLYYGIVGFVPAFIITSSIAAMLFTTAIVSYENAIFDKKHFEKLSSFNDFISIFQSNPVVFGILSAILLIISVFYYLKSYLRIINKSFRLSNFVNRRAYLFVFAKFFLSTIVIGSIYEALGYTITLALPSVEIVVDYAVRLFSLVTIIFFWHYDLLAGNLRRNGKEEKVSVSKKISKIWSLKYDRVGFAARILVFLLLTGLVFKLAAFSLELTTEQLPVFYPEQLISKPWFVFYNWIIGLSFAGFFSLSLFYALFSNLNSRLKTLLIKMIPAALAALVIVVNLSYEQRYLERLDFYKYIDEEAGISDQGEDTYNTAIVFRDGIKLISYPMESSHWSRDKKSEYKFNLASTYSDNSDLPTIKLDCTSENIKKIESLEAALQSKDYRSVLAADYFFNLSSCYQLNWQTEDYAKINRLAFEKTNSVIHGLSYLSRRWAGYDEKRLLEYKELVSSDRYRIGNNSRKRIAETLLYYGKADEARTWFLGTDEDLSKHDFSAKVFGGSVKGSIRINDDLRSAIRVGLFLNASNTQDVSIGTLVNYDEDMRIVASSDVEADGSFAFEKLREGEYELGLLIMERKLEKSQIKILPENGVEKIVIDADSFNHDLGEIYIDVNQ